MIAKKIEEQSVDKNNKYSNLSRPRTSPLDFGSPVTPKKSNSVNEKNSYSISKANKLKNSNNSFSIGQNKNSGYNNSNNDNNSLSYQSDSNVKYNAPSSSSSLVDRMFMTQTSSKKFHFNPNDFSNSDNSFYVNSDSILKSNNMSIYSVDSLNENYIVNLIFN